MIIWKAELPAFARSFGEASREAGIQSRLPCGLV